MKKWFVLLIFALFGYYLVGANFSAKLGMIDDHEIPLFLGSDGVIKTREIPSILQSTELGRWGEYQRLRPSYYTLRVLETALWRDKAGGWYATRLVMLIASMYLLWKILRRFFPAVLALATVGYVMIPAYWADIWTRLGPSESYATVATLMFVEGMLGQKLGLIAVGYLIAVGSKENMLILLPFLLIYLGYRAYQKKLSAREGGIITLLLAYTAYIVGGIALGTAKASADVYGTTISYKERLMTLYSYKRYIVATRHLQIPVLAGVIGSVVVMYALVKRGFKTLWRDGVIQPLLLLVVLTGVIASQFIFYNNQLPSNMRYDFPAMLLFPMAQLVGVKLLLSLIPSTVRRSVTKITYLGLTIGLIVVSSRAGYGAIRERAVANAKATQKFAQGIEQATQILQQNPTTPVVFASQKYFDYEPIVSVSRYLVAQGITNPMQIEYTNEPNVTDPLGIELEKQLNEAKRGESGPEGLFARFSPNDQARERCYALIFGAATAPTPCEPIAHF